LALVELVKPRIKKLIDTSQKNLPDSENVRLLIVVLIREELSVVNSNFCWTT